jgi:UDP-glucose 4-epimerase
MDIAGRTILVTGAAGHLGGHIVEQLLDEQPAGIVALDRTFGGGETESPKLYDSPLVRRLECDITDRAALAGATRGIDAVVHTAGQLSREVISDLRRGFEVNIGGTFSLIEESVKAGVRKFVFTSSSSVYDGRQWPAEVIESNAYDPASLYGAAKAAGEMFLSVFHAAHGLDYVALRCATIYGVRQSLRSNTARLIPESFARIAEGLPPIVYGDGTAAYDFVNVVDVARAHVMAIRSPVKAGACNIATGKTVPVAAVARLIAEVAGFKDPLAFAEQGSRNNIPTHVFDVTKAERELGFKAGIDLREGLEIYHRSRKPPPSAPA